MDTNGVITISSKDWSKQPSVDKTENIPEIILYWKHSTVSSALAVKPQNCPKAFNNSVLCLKEPKQKI